MSLQVQLCGATLHPFGPLKFTIVRIGKESKHRDFQFIRSANWEILISTNSAVLTIGSEVSPREQEALVEAKYRNEIRRMIHDSMIFAV